VRDLAATVGEFWRRGRTARHRPSGPWAAPRRSVRRPLAEVQADERRARERSGRLAEWLAALHLTLRGYRVLATRQRSRLGEIDLVAVRGRRLAFVEVKFRRDEALARESISDLQARRVADAAEQWVWRHKRYRNHEIGLDSMLVVPWRLPRHVPNALQPD